MENEGKILLFYDMGYSLYALELSGSPVPITTDATIGKAIVGGGRFYVVWAHVDAGANIWGDYIGLSTSNDGSTWTNSGGIASWPGLTNWDPVLFNDEGLFRLFWAPSNSEQFIATSQSTSPTDPASWSPPARVTTASYDSERWWDFWPRVIRDQNGNILFYTSESSSDGTHRIDGNISMMNLGGAPAPVGGILAPANTIALLAPYLALLGLVLAGTIVVSSCVTFFGFAANKGLRPSCWDVTWSTAVSLSASKMSVVGSVPSLSSTPKIVVLDSISLRSKQPDQSCTRNRWTRYPSDFIISRNPAISIDGMSNLTQG